MNKIFTTMKSNVGSFVQDTSTALASLIGVWINNRYRDIVSSYDWEQMYYTQTISVSANVSAYPIDEGADRLMFVQDTTNSSYLNIINEERFLHEYYDIFNDTGTPTRCFLTSDVVRAQPASAEKPTVKSSSASDTSQSVFLRGITSTGGETYETINLNGTTVATAANSYTRILMISKSAATSGKISVMENDEATVLSEMSPERLESYYKSLRLHLIPVGAMTLYARIRRKATPLAQDYDTPVIDDIADILEAGAEADAFRYKRQYSKASVFETQYQVAKSDRIHREVAQPGLVHQMTPTSLNRDDGIL
jgi:hypothetical protein